MTLEEKVICETYTGICFTSSEERSEVYRYAEKLMGRPVYTHEFPGLADQLKERSRADFIMVCKGELAADVVPVRHGKWIKLDMHAGMEQYKCSCCRTACYVPECMGEPLYHYCPECGAKMDGGDHGEQTD